MAHKKAAGSTDNLKDSNPKYRGVKLFGGQTARAGNIIIRQKGDKFALGHNTYKGRDFTIHAALDGVVSFRKKRILRYDGRTYLRTVVDVIPTGGYAVAGKKPTPKSVKPTAVANPTKGKAPVKEVAKAPVSKAPAKAKPAKSETAKAKPTAKKPAPKKPVTKKKAPVKAKSPAKTATKKPAAKKAPAKAKPAKK